MSSCSRTGDNSCKYNARSRAGIFQVALFASVASLCLGAQIATAETDPQRQQNDTSYTVVDCLMPGRVQQLGRHITYVSRRQMRKLTVNDCQIAGGEFTVYDRGSVTGSIQAWLPFAREGDGQAQSYLGQLFEKGMDGQPDYAMARHWYKLAAEQDLAEAQFNLARLYDSGLGGEADPALADYWYRKAFGLDEDIGSSVELVAPVSVEELQATIVSQEEIIVSQEGEIEALEAQVAALEAQVYTLEEERNSLVATLVLTEQQLAFARNEFASAVASEGSALDEIEALRRQLDLRRGELEAGESRLREQEAQIASQRDMLQTALEEARQNSAGEAELHRQVDQLMQQISSLRSESESLRSQLASLQTARGAQSDHVDELRAQLEARLSDAAAREAALAEQENALASQRAELAVSSEGLATEQSDLAAAEAEIRATQIDLAAERDALSQQIAEFEAARGALALREDEIASRQASLSDLQATLAARESEISKALEDVGAREENLARVQDEAVHLTLLRESLEADQARMADARAELLEQQVDLESRDQAFSARLAEYRVRAAELDNREQVLADREAAAIAREEQIQLELRRLEAAIGGLRSADTVRPDAAERHAIAAEQMDRSIFGNYHALLIGNQNYRDERWADLQTPHNDVDAISALLTEKYGFETTVLKDASRDEMMRTLSEISRSLGPNDNFLIYFAGHGSYQDGEAFWEPVNSVYNEPYVNSIDLENINQHLQITQARKVLVVADSCYAGGWSGSPAPQLVGDMSVDEQIQLLRVRARSRSRNILTAGTVRPVVDGLGGGHSIFALAFQDALARNADIVGAQDLFPSIYRYVARSTGQLSLDQQPQYSTNITSGHEGGDFIFYPMAP